MLHKAAHSCMQTLVQDAHSPKAHGDSPELHHNHRVPQPHYMQDHLQVGRQAADAVQEQHRRVSTAQALTQSALQGVGGSTQQEASTHAEP